MTSQENEFDNNNEQLRLFRQVLNRLFLRYFPRYLEDLRSNESLNQTLSFLEAGEADIPIRLRQQISFDQERKAVRVGDSLLKRGRVVVQPAVWPEGDTEAIVELELLNQPTTIGPTVILNNYKEFEDNLLEIIAVSQMPVLSRLEGWDSDLTQRIRIIEPEPGEFIEDVYDGEQED